MGRSTFQVSLGNAGIFQEGEVRMETRSRNPGEGCIADELTTRGMVEESETFVLDISAKVTSLREMSIT